MPRIHDERIERFTNIDIYPVISSEFTLERDVLEVLRQIAAGGAKIVQLREKNKTKREILALARKYRRITSEYGMLLMINDHLDIALAVGADGVHLGQDDLPIRVARELAPDLLLGCSTHNFEEIAEAEASGASCINIGPIFTTSTKAVNCGALGIDYLKQAASRTKLPFSVMGGIKEQHIPELLAAGASRIAMVTEITQAPDITAQVRRLRSLMV
jgi:thiamine-phosphate pyrophosphorylase